MILQELLVIEQRGILADLLRNFAMLVEKLVEARQLPVCWVQLARIVPSIIAFFLKHERIRILSQSVADTRVILQVRLQLGMVLQELLVIQQGWVSADLLGDLTMLVEKLVEARQFLAHRFAGSRIFLPVIAVFRVHEGGWIFLYLLAYTRMVPQISLQVGMVLQELLVIQQRGILTNLLGDFAMAVEKLIEVREFPSR